MSFQKIAADVRRKQIAQEVVNTILYKRAAEQEEQDTSYGNKQLRVQRRNAGRGAPGSARPSNIRPKRTRPSRGKERKVETEGETYTKVPGDVPRDTRGNIHVSEEPPVVYDPGAVPEYGSPEYEDRMKAAGDNYLHWTYGRNPAIDQAINEQVNSRVNWWLYPWWYNLYQKYKGNRDTRRHDLVVAGMPKFKNESSRYSTYVQKGQTFSKEGLQAMINSRAQEFAAAVCPDPHDVRGRARAIAYFRAAANQTLNDWNYTQLEEKPRPGQQFRRARGPRNQGTNAVRYNFDFSGFTPEQIREMKRLGQLMMYDPDYKYQYK